MVANTLAYYDTSKNIAFESFLVQALAKQQDPYGGPLVSKAVLEMDLCIAPNPFDNLAMELRALNNVNNCLNTNILLFLGDIWWSKFQSVFKCC